MVPTRRKCRILEEMHETAQGLRRAGLISRRRMGEFEVLCDLEVPEMPARRIKALREGARDFRLS